MNNQLPHTLPQGQASPQAIADALLDGTRTPQGVQGIPKALVDLARQPKHPQG